METVVVAFAGEQNGRRVKEILESAGAASCLLCRSADQVRRLVGQQRITTVVCGYKFPDGTAEELFYGSRSPGCPYMRELMKLAGK